LVIGVNSPEHKVGAAEGLFGVGDLSRIKKRNAMKFRAELQKNPEMSAMRKLLLASKHNIINKKFMEKKV
jgi:hypothetical protein